MSQRPVLALLVIAAAFTASSAAAVTLVTNANILTMDAAHPRAQAMAFDGDGKILALGEREDLAKRYPDASALDAKGATVVPGLIDAHGHLLRLGLMLLRADLIGALSKAQVIERLQTYAKTLPKDAWLLGRGWDQNLWPEKSFPTAADLDRAFPDRPVWLERVDGHAGWANSAALAKARRDLEGEWQPDGGRIHRGGGRPTGVFVDNAMALIDDVVPPVGAALTERALKLAFSAAVSHGLTGVHDPGMLLDEFELLQRMAADGALPLRVYAMAEGDGPALDYLCRKGPVVDPSGRLSLRAVKLYIDGALGSRGAALLADYSDEPGNRGLLLTAEKDFERIVSKARGCKVQVATHAIGDRGNRIVLDTYERVLGAAAKSDHRWRIEHAQVISLADIGRFAPLGVIASMQPTHATSDMPWAQARIGAERIAGAYAWRALRDAGARLALGSDFPVESVDPRLGLYAAVTRSDGAGKPPGGWRAEQKLTAYEALRGFTLDAAFAGFAEHEVGSLEAGKRADFVRLDEDPLTAAPERLRQIKVLATYVDGKAVYEAP
jgi:hypothetical protein